MNKLIQALCVGAAGLLLWKSPLAYSAAYADTPLPEPVQPADSGTDNEEEAGTIENTPADNEAGDAPLVLEEPDELPAETAGADAEESAGTAFEETGEVQAEETQTEETQPEESLPDVQTSVLIMEDPVRSEEIFPDLFMEDLIPAHPEDESVIYPETAARAADWKAQGVFGFYDYYGSKDALKVISTHASAADAANPHNALAWNNFKASMQYIRECNALRARHNLPALQVSDAMMAIAQVQSNASARTLDHSRLYTVSENLAWGMKIGAPMGTAAHNNPFDYWYTDEKQIYDRNPNAPFMEVAHYLNIIKPNMKVTGFACNSMRPNNRTLFCQVFSASSTDRMYTVQEYEDRIAAYEKAMESGASNGTNGSDSIPSHGIPTYRLYNPNSSEHFYTQDLNERNYLRKVGWSDEGVGWIAGKTGDPVYRLYNAANGDHHYTVDAHERDQLSRYYGWTYEGIGWYSPKDGETIIYRQYNPNADAGAHNFTADLNEVQFLISQGWIDEGAAFRSY